MVQTKPRNKPEPDTAPDNAVDAKEEFSLIPKEKLIALYVSLLQSNGSVQKQGRTRLGRQWAAVQAAAPGLLLDTNSDDLVVAASMSAALSKLLPSAPASNPSPEERLPEIIGKSLAYKTQQNGRIAIALWRDADQQSWLDAMEIARAHTLPVVFVCPPLSPESVKQVASHAKLPGTELPRITVDGYDPVAVYRVAHESIDRARRNRGPSLIECAEFRVAGMPRQNNAIANIERYLMGKTWFTPEMKRELRHKAK